MEDYKPIRCSSAERRKLVRRLGNLHGEPQSMEALAECLECGKCTKQDPKRAAELRKAAAAKEGNRSA